MPGRAPRSWRIIAASRRREGFFDDLMAATMICEQAKGSFLRYSGVMNSDFGRACGRHLSRLIGEASGSFRRLATGVAQAAKKSVNFFAQDLLHLSDFSVISNRAEASVRLEIALGDLSAGPGAGQRIHGLAPFPLPPTTRARAVIRRRYAIALVPTGSRHGPPASTRAAPQRVPPWPTKCSSTPPTRRKPA